MQNTGDRVLLGVALALAAIYALPDKPQQRYMKTAALVVLLVLLWRQMSRSPFESYVDGPARLRSPMTYLPETVSKAVQYRYIEPYMDPPAGYDSSMTLVPVCRRAKALRRDGSVRHARYRAAIIKRDAPAAALAAVKADTSLEWKIQPTHAPGNLIRR